MDQTENPYHLEKAVHRLDLMENHWLTAHRLDPMESPCPLEILVPVVHPLDLMENHLLMVHQ